MRSFLAFLAYFVFFSANFDINKLFQKLIARIILVLDATFVPNLTFLGL